MEMFFLLMFITVVGISANSDELLTKLMADYDPTTRPDCYGFHTPVNVTLDLGLRQLIELNEPFQLLQLSVWIRLYWNDCRLRWNKTEFGGQDSLVVPESSVWIPDIEVYDSTSDDIRREREFRVAIYSSGDIRFLYQAVLDARCTIDVTLFPFDMQHCPMSFGSWAYHGHELDIFPRSKSGDLDSMVKNVEWEVDRFPAVRKTEYFNCCPEPYPYITFTLSMKRKPNFYIINLILPSVFVMGLTMMVFVIPVDSGEKVSFAVTLMLALAVFQLMLADALPPSSETVPIIAGYFAISEGLVGFVCVAAIFVLNIHSRGERNMPHWVRKIFLGRLSKLFCHSSKNDWVTIDKDPTKQEDTIKHIHFPPNLADEWKRVATVIEKMTATLFIPSLLVISLYVFISLIG